LKRVKRITKYFIYSFIFVFITIYYGCSEKQKLDVKTLAKVYTEILVNNELYSSNPDSLNIMKQRILNSYNLTEDEYINEFKKFENDENLWKEFFKEARIYLDSLKNKSISKRKKDAF